MFRRILFLLAMAPLIGCTDSATSSGDIDLDGRWEASLSASSSFLIDITDADGALSGMGGVVTCGGVCQGMMGSLEGERTGDVVSFTVREGTSTWVFDGRVTSGSRISVTYTGNGEPRGTLTFKR